MHELSIAMGIVEFAEEEARKNGATISAIHLKLGQLSGVVRDALQFSFEVACQGTAAEGSRLVIEEVPITLYCGVCEAERNPEPAYRLWCPVCDNPAPQIVRGKELEVVGLEIG